MKKRVRRSRDITENGIQSCYGYYNSWLQVCLGCGMARWCCAAARGESAEIHRSRERINMGVAGALEKFAELPPDVSIPERGEIPTWQALVQIVSYLASLGGATLQALKNRVQNREWQAAQKERRAAALRPAVAAAVTPERRLTITTTALADGWNVYLAGPMSGIQELNAPAFYDAEARLQERYSVNVINPQYTPHLMGFGRAHEDYMSVSMALVATSDALVMLPGWRKSKGAAAEHSYAKMLQKKIYELEEVLP